MASDENGIGEVGDHSEYGIEVGETGENATTVNVNQNNSGGEEEDLDHQKQKSNGHVNAESHDNVSPESSELDDAEIACLGPDSDEDVDSAELFGETPADVAFAKTKKQQKEILELIETTKSSGSTSIDLSRKNLLTIPDALLELPQLEFLYMEGNDIAYLPDEFFKCFPRLRWLDLRNNVLSRIPAVYLANHSCLRNLLLESNNLRNLPLELGQVKSLHGLNIANNPLDFPPQDIIERGTQAILNFLLEMMEAKNNAKMADLELDLSQEVPDVYEQISASSDDWNTTASMMDLAKRREKAGKGKFSEITAKSEKIPEEYNLGARSAELHRPPTYSDNKLQHIQKLKKAGALGVVDRKKTKESKMSWKVNQYPAPPGPEYVTYKMNEEKHLARVKEFKEKTDAILQRRKDNAMLKGWRDEAKVLQQKKYSQRLQPGKDYEEAPEQAPFGVDKDQMKVLSKEERVKADIEREKELKKQRAVSPATRQRIEQEKQTRIRELEKRIKDHTASMVDRRKRPKGTPQHEMEIARRELEIAEQLHNELLSRRQDIEYRFKSYSADLTTVGRQKKTAAK